MAQRYYGMTHDEVLAHVKGEYELSRRFVDQKRQLFRERLKDYTNITTDKNKIYVRLIYSVVQTLMALQYSDEMTVEFVGRQLGADVIAEQLENLARFDFEEMEMDKLSYNVEWDRLFFGVGILVFDHWDTVKKVPIYRRMNPLTWIPDLNPDDLQGARYHQFEIETSVKAMQAKGYYNINKLVKAINQETELTKQAYRDNREITHQTEEKVQAHYCFTTIDGVKYFVVAGGGFQTINHMEKLEAVFEEEKKDPTNIKFPVFVFHYSPMEYDPYGICVPDLLADKQRAQQMLLNLEKTKAWQAAHGSMFGVDENKVNVNDLTRPTTTTRFIKVKGGDISNAIVEIPKSRPDMDVFAVSQQLKQQATLDIGLDERSLGVGGANALTATENQRIQKNANLKQILNTKIKMWSLKRFWRDWYKRYYENFKWSDQKNIIINTQISTKPITVKRKDIVSGYDIDIKIVSKAEQEATRQQELLAIEMEAQSIMADPNASMLSRNMIRRKKARLKGFSHEEALVWYPPTPSERIAMQHVEYLNDNQLPPDAIRTAAVDVDTFLTIAHRAIPTKAKFAYITALEDLAIALPQQQPQPTQPQGGSVNQLANAAIQQNTEQEAASLQDVT